MGEYTLTQAEVDALDRALWASVEILCHGCLEDDGTPERQDAWNVLCAPPAPVSVVK